LTCSRMRLHAARYVAPAPVNVSLRVVRNNSRAFTCRSKSAILRLTVASGIFNCRLAADRLPASTTAIIKAIASNRSTALSHFMRSTLPPIDPYVQAPGRLQYPRGYRTFGDSAMSYGFLDIAATASVKAAQAANGSAQMWENLEADRAFDQFTAAETSFIGARDSFYMATVSQSGWPYVQHRGGPPGFVRVLDAKTLGFADLRGNRQYISVGNLAADDRAALIFLDYPHKRRLKLYAHVESKNLGEDPALAAALALPGYRAKAERGIILHLTAFDWNCPQHITPRFSEAELEPALQPLRERLSALEAENEQLRKQLARGQRGGDGAGVEGDTATGAQS
jgi:predicted pyridoxine 5'-phosphate oxidase superfamily flavin-nucleotide-binding protein